MTHMKTPSGEGIKVQSCQYPLRWNPVEEVQVKSQDRAQAGIGLGK